MSDVSILDNMNNGDNFLVKIILHSPRGKRESMLFSVYATLLREAFIIIT
jgi:hypothetical protein